MVELFIRYGATRTLMYDEVDNAGHDIMQLALEGEADLDSPVVRGDRGCTHKRRCPDSLLLQFFLALFLHDDRIFSEMMPESHDGMTYLDTASELGCPPHVLAYINSFPSNREEPTVVRLLSRRVACLWSGVVW
jgi:hypothetical protein